jgi:heat shock protein HtpX
MERVSFYDEIKRNKRNSYFLVGTVLLVLLSLVYVISLALNEAYSFTILFFGIIFSLVYVVGGYFFSDKLALASVNAKPASQAEFRQFHNIVEGLCLASGLPKPRLFVMDDSQINAFASGRDPKHAVICVTRGCLEKLNKQELEGVLAHELSHVANYDIKFMTLVAVLVGMISIIAEIFLRSLFWGSFNDRDNNKGNVIFLIIGIVLAILAPLVVSLVQLAISRKREYAADSSAVKFMRSPTGLIGALEKIKYNSESKKVSGAVAPLFIAKPNKAKELFSTHPSLESRIEKLRKM